MTTLVSSEPIMYLLRFCVRDPALFFFSSRRRHTGSYGDWSSDVCSSDLIELFVPHAGAEQDRGNRRDEGDEGEGGRFRGLEEPLPSDERDDGACERKEQDRSNALRPRRDAPGFASP